MRPRDQYRLGTSAFIVVLALVAWRTACPGPVGAQTQSGAAPASLAAVASQAKVNSRAYEYLRELCDEIGSRLTGSPQEKRARQWAIEKLKRMGLQNAHEESWQMARGWTRIAAQAEMRSPARQYLTVTSQGWAGSTRSGGAEAEVVAVNRNRLEDERKRPQPWRGKILLLASKGVPAGVFDIFGQMGSFLKSAHASGAVAVIDVEGTPDSRGMNLTQTDLADVAGSYSEIPVVRMVPEHHGIISRLLSRGRTVQVWIDVQNRVTSGPVDTANVIGEIRGTQHPEEIVVLGAHLDSWDLGQGAGDDGFGVAAVLASAEAIAKSGFRPNRTIRFALFTGEEQGIKGSQAYVKSHRREMENHVAAVFADMGDGAPIGLMLNGREDLVPAIEQVSPWLAEGTRLKVTDAPFTLGDSISFTLAGVPGIDLWQDTESFKHTRHSVVDTFDKVKPENLVRSAGALAVLAFWIADRPERLAVPLSGERIEQLLTRMKVNDLLKLLDLRSLGRQ